ncbi:hypothetical protein FLAG1_05074 [Fusarium langsethiae]|uniref:Uncharacterized protein n=1 Tax=Fusarium langsethiae TaxID=179993 RepID=A0A0M9EXQ5_FUSLA|nr:hypothetical protein FLAG1_05074 [Fusarium langsethiae]GKU04671.1 unnamed protein product [Fusarium langsethiae]GKU19158.1 unnamed protein product [Fusarium langsethiae]
MPSFTTAYYVQPENITSLLASLLATVSVVAFLAIVIIIIFIQKRIEKSIYDDVYAAIQDAAAARKGGETSSNQDSDGEPEKQSEPRLSSDENSNNTAV